MGITLFVGWRMWGEVVIESAWENITRNSCLDVNVNSPI